MQNKFQMKGIFQVVEKDNETGEVLDTFTEENVITDIAFEHLIQSFTNGTYNNKIIQTISLGDDIGTGTLLSPEAPSSSITEADHNLVFEIPSPEFFVDYPDALTVRFYGTVNGATVMSNYPSEANVVYTSAMLKLSSLEPFSYKRFSARTISELISVDISWTITFSEIQV